MDGQSLYLFPWSTEHELKTMSILYRYTFFEYMYMKLTQIHDKQNNKRCACFI